MNTKMRYPLYLVLILSLMGYGLVYPLITELFAGEEGAHLAAGLPVGLRYFYLSLSFLLFPLAMFFGTPWLKNLAVKWGQKKALLVSVGGITLGYFLIGMGVDLFCVSLLFIGRALSGLMAGCQVLASEGISQETQGTPSHLKTFILGIGLAIGPFIGGICSDPLLLPFFNLSFPFYLAGDLGIVTLVWMVFSLPKGERHKHSIEITKPFKLVREAFTLSSVRPLIWAFLFLNIGFSLFFQLIQPFLSVYFEYSSWQLGLYNGFLGIAFAIVVFASRKVLEGRSPEKVASKALFVAGLALLLAMLLPLELFVWILSFVVAGSDLLGYGALLIFLSGSISSSNFSDIMGVLVALAWVLTGLAPNLVLFIGFPWLIAVGGLFILAAAVLVLLYQRRVTQESPLS